VDTLQPPAPGTPTGMLTPLQPYSSVPQKYEQADMGQTSALAQSPLFAPATLLQQDWSSPTVQPGLEATVPSLDPGRLTANEVAAQALELAPRVFLGSQADQPVPVWRELLADTQDAASVVMGSGAEPPDPFGTAPMTTPLGADTQYLQGVAGAGTRFEPLGRSAYEDFTRAVDWLEQYPAPLAYADTAGEAGQEDREDLAAVRGQALAVVGQTLKSYAGGDTTSAVNRFLIDAESFVGKGEFYRAANLYGQAETLDRENPLIRMGHGHALLFAGDYAGAVYHLTRGLERFEDIAYFKIDLTQFIPDPTILDIRRADLERRLERRENFRLRFLLGYAEYYSGLEQFGLPNLEQAAGEAVGPSQDPLLRRGERRTAAIIAAFPAQLQRKPLFAPIPPQEEPEP
jgi:hypothetical protein